MAVHDNNDFDAYGRYEEIRKTKKSGESFFDHFTKETQEEFEKFIDVFWKTEYPAKRTTYLQYFSFIKKVSNSKSTGISREELERIIDSLVLFIFLAEEKNNLSANFAKKILSNISLTASGEAFSYLTHFLTGSDSTLDKRFYLQELVATLRGNRGVCNHYSHKKFKLEKNDYLPVG